MLSGESWMQYSEFLGQICIRGGNGDVEWQLSVSGNLVVWYGEGKRDFRGRGISFSLGLGWGKCTPPTCVGDKQERVWVPGDVVVLVQLIMAFLLALLAAALRTCRVMGLGISEDL